MTPSGPFILHITTAGERWDLLVLAIRYVDRLDGSWMARPT